MDDHDKLTEFLWGKVRHYGIESFNLHELKELRELCTYAIIQRLEESAPLVYREIFQEREKCLPKT